MLHKFSQVLFKRFCGLRVCLYQLPLGKATRCGRDSEHYFVLI